eukprot:1035706-Lingulodinium_polyedra.AAC.1
MAAPRRFRHARRRPPAVGRRVPRRSEAPRAGGNAGPVVGGLARPPSGAGARGAAAGCTVGA